MSNENTAPYAIWVLRLIMGFVLLTHVELNFGGLDPAVADTWLGLPAGVSGYAMTLEVVIAWLLIVGIWPRVAALVGAASLLWAIASARGASIFFSPGFNWKTPGMWLGSLLLVSLFGDGAFVLLPTEFHPWKETKQ